MLLNPTRFRMALKTIVYVLLTLSFSLFCNCAYRHYLGLHGPSIKKHPDTHFGISLDTECLSCHHPGKPTDSPPTSHPDFVGCLKCHSDDMKSTSK